MSRHGPDDALPRDAPAADVPAHPWRDRVVLAAIGGLATGAVTSWAGNPWWLAAVAAAGAAVVVLVAAWVAGTAPAPPRRDG
ncbi:hypothetical protein [Actinotalea subterranea]|uniref:hypothetical protein n=1 Tax=Actinotalea subterranea TaxID=2607497 RepID=UPI0011ECF4CD|nr:hypothetical protein [Actinotalea subterranea]